jgi:uncharacterized damage-inducible protein DinB
MGVMIPMLQSLWAHLTWADTVILKLTGSQEGAYADEEVRKLLNHIAGVEYFFLSLFQGRPFDLARIRYVAGNIEEMERLFEQAHADGAAYVARLDDAELARTLEFPVPGMKDFHPQVRDGLMQVIMHSEHHRGQVAMRLRAMGAKPPVTDYIAWLRQNSLS